MPEANALSALIGALATVSVTSIGALAWMVKQRSNGHVQSSNGQKHATEDIGRTLVLHTALLQELVALARVHNAEASARHTALVEALRKG